MSIENLEDIPGALHVRHDWGDRYRGWYFFKKFLRRQAIPIHYKGTDISFDFKVCEYRYQFIMPSKLEFYNGLITYNNDERMLGVFRFPREDDGSFRAPFPWSHTANQVRSLTPEEISKLIGRKSVLVFEAFRIPSHIFEFVSLDNEDVMRIKYLTDESFSEELRSFYASELDNRISEVKEKIKSSCDILLILENTLNRQWKNMKELALATNNILHIYGSES